MAVCRVVPVVAIMPVVPAGKYRRFVEEPLCRGTTTSVLVNDSFWLGMLGF